jgi:hypothetical protein
MWLTRTNQIRNNLEALQKIGFKKSHASPEILLFKA